MNNPADTYRKLGFKDVCTEYYYINLAQNQ